MTSKHYAAYCRQQLWKRRLEALVAYACIPMAAFVGAMGGIALDPWGDYVSALAQVAVVAGSIALVPTVGAIIAAIKAS